MRNGQEKASILLEQFTAGKKHYLKSQQDVKIFLGVGLLLGAAVVPLAMFAAAPIAATGLGLVAASFVVCGALILKDSSEMPKTDIVRDDKDVLLGELLDTSNNKKDMLQNWEVLDRLFESPKNSEQTFDESKLEGVHRAFENYQAKKSASGKFLAAGVLVGGIAAGAAIMMTFSPIGIASVAILGVISLVSVVVGAKNYFFPDKSEVVSAIEAHDASAGEGSKLDMATAARNEEDNELDSEHNPNAQGFLDFKAGISTDSSNNRVDPVSSSEFSAKEVGVEMVAGVSGQEKTQSQSLGSEAHSSPSKDGSSPSPDSPSLGL